MSDWFQYFAVLLAVLCVGFMFYDAYNYDYVWTPAVTPAHRELCAVARNHEQCWRNLGYDRERVPRK